MFSPGLCEDSYFDIMYGFIHGNQEDSFFGFRSTEIKYNKDKILCYYFHMRKIFFRVKAKKYANKMINSKQRVHIEVLDNQIMNSHKKNIFSSSL